MGLQENLQNIQTNLLQAKTAIAQSIAAKGVECSADDKLSTFAEKIDSISGGGTGNKIMLTDGTKFAYSTTFDPELYDVSNVTDMSTMFYNCSGLTSLDLSNWNTSNVTNMGAMFYICGNLTNIDVSNWNTSNVTDMSKMFSGCTKLTSLDLSTWDTNKVTNMGTMFNNCLGLTSLDLSTWDTNKVTTMQNMFSYCSDLTSLGLSNWNTSKVTNMLDMFNNCKSLANLQFNDLGHNQICTSLDLTACSALTKDSILYLFNNAFDRSAAGYTKAFTIRLNATIKALLTEEEIAIATNKGFTVV